MTQETPLIVHQVRLAIEHRRVHSPPPLPFHALHHLRQRGLAMQSVAGVEEDDVVARGIEQRLVHGIIEPVVGFADEAYVVACLVLLDIAMDEG